jgi:NADH-quinone oxidoreductase subunit A
MLFDFAAALIFLLVGLAFVYVNLAVGALLRPRVYTKDKMRIYECGEPTVGSSWIRYNIRFYTIALVFLVFDVEVVFLFPVAAVLRWFVAHGMGWIALFEIAAFVGVLLLGLVYAWRYGNLDWVMSTGPDHHGIQAVPDDGGMNASVNQSLRQESA